MSGPPETNFTIVRTAAINAARHAASNTCPSYPLVVHQWLTLQTTAGLYAALASLAEAGFSLNPSEVERLLKRALTIAEDDFWERHRIIDSLDGDVGDAARAAIAGVLGGLTRWHLRPRLKLRLTL